MDSDSQGNSHSQLQQACDVLGVEPGIARADLDAAYLELIERCDPAKVGPEFALLAMRKLTVLTAAFDTVLKSLDGGP